MDHDRRAYVNKHSHDDKPGQGGKGQAPEQEHEHASFVEVIGGEPKETPSGGEKSVEHVSDKNEVTVNKELDCRKQEIVPIRICNTKHRTMKQKQEEDGGIKIMHTSELSQHQRQR